jgi:hypothetical protein
MSPSEEDVGDVTSDADTESERIRKDIEIDKVKSDKEFEAKVKSDKEFETKVKSDKEFEKAKSDKEFEKVKRDDEKLPEKVKPEKEHKLEAKEFEKVKDDKEQFEKTFPEKQSETEASLQGRAAGLDAAALLAHADSLMETGRQLRHFIERSLRPDLSTGALRNEEDQQDEPDTRQDD